MSALFIDQLTSALKRTAIDQPLRYNPLYYGKLRGMLRNQRAMSKSDRRVMSDRLLARTLQRASRLPGGLSPLVPLGKRPIVDSTQLRDHPARYSRHCWARVPAATSGSTGVPVRLWRSLQCIAAEQAFIDDVVSSLGIELRKARIARLRGDPVKPVTDRSPPFGVYTDGGKQLVLSTDHLDANSVSWYVEELHRFRPEVMFVHPAAAESLADHLKQRGLRLDIAVVLGSSETVFESGWQLIEETFGARFVDHYGLAERVAYATASSVGNYFFNPLYSRIELLPLPDVEAPPNCMALDIVGTGFWNAAMPLVRYRTGDRAIVPSSYTNEDLDAVALGLKPVCAIQGRGKEHVTAASGAVILGMVHATTGVTGLIRMQIVQEAPGQVYADVIVNQQFGPAAEACLLRNLRQRLNEEFTVEVRTVTQLQRAPSGKTPFILRHY